MKHPRSALYYPVVIKRSLDYVTISVPDIGITLVENIPDSNKLDKDYVTRIGNKVAEAWVKTQEIMKKKESKRNPLPEASLVRDSLKVAERPLTPTKFAKYVGVSYRTIIRDCEKGLIRSERTSGGHYKIPHSEIAIYKTYLKNHVKFAREPWAKPAVENLRSHSVDTASDEDL
jgi:excisionase family DNA binding protein